MQHDKYKWDSFTSNRYGYGYTVWSNLPSASAMDVQFQSPVPQLTSGERQARRDGGPGKGRRRKFYWSKVGGMFQSEWDMR